MPALHNFPATPTTNTKLQPRRASLKCSSLRKSSVNCKWKPPLNMFIQILKNRPLPKNREKVVKLF